MSVLLVDGTNLFCVHYAANTAMDTNGNPIGAVVGFTRLLSKFVEAMAPEKVIVFFDGKNGSAKRKSLFRDYKGGRKPRMIIGRQIGFSTEDAALRNKDWQFSNLLSLLDCLPVQVVITDDYEADDGAAYFLKHKKRYGHEKSDVIILSCDKDFSQLLSEEVSIYNPINKNFITTENFVEKYEVSHRNWLFFRSVCGDPSDNLDGVKGFGAKTLQKLFDIQNPDATFTPADINASIIDHKNMVKLKEGLDVIERNWKLMDLSNPLISLSTADKLDYQFMNFKPKMNRKDFILQCATLGFVDQAVLPRFIGLNLRGKEENV